MFLRSLKLPLRHSFFLFGARGVGKSTLLKTVLPVKATHTVDLLDFDLQTRLIRNPAEFSQILSGLPKETRWVVVDEIQKIPPLLDEIHRAIENGCAYCFALTGSSARKLKKGRANLLAGRAFAFHLYPLTLRELGDRFLLSEALEYGTLPKIFFLADGEEKRLFLKTYAQTYLQEEVFSEGILRDLVSFRNFLPLAAQSNGEILSWSNFAQDTGIDAKTVRSYFEILEDTLVGFILPAYSRSLRKRQRTHPKFYFFDTGVKRALAGELSVPLASGTSEYGKAFEHFWIAEIFRESVYRGKDYRFSYFATNDVEIDLVIETPNKNIFLVEFKSASRVKDAELLPLARMSREIKNAHGVCFCNEPRKRIVNGVTVAPWRQGLEEIGLG